MKRATLGLVELVWEDITSHPDWYEISDAVALGCVRVKTVGYVLKRTKTHLMLVSSQMNDGKSIGDVLVIPLSNVKTIRRLR